MTSKHAAIIYNPIRIPLDRVRRLVAVQEKRQGWNPSMWYSTSSHDSGRGAAERALKSTPDVVIVAGGDGTIRTVAEVIVDSAVPLALLPFGTGNLLARNLGLSVNDIKGAVYTAFTGSSRRIDMAFAESEDPDGYRHKRPFLVMAGIGLDAEMAEKTSALAKRHLGWLAYVSPIARSIIANRQFTMHYRIDGGRTRSDRAHTVIVGNCGTLTGKMLLFPDARLDDGLLDVVVLRPKGRFQWARIGTRLTLQRMVNRSRFGTRMLRLAPGLQALGYTRGKQFDISFDTPHGVELDGDSIGRITSARITIRPGVLDVRVRGGAKSPH